MEEELGLDWRLLIWIGRQDSASAVNESTIIYQPIPIPLVCR